jgi:hypothetical protein
MSAAVLPANATNSAVTWSTVNGPGQATISAGGLLTAVANGTMTVKATAQDGSGIFGSLQITISNSQTSIPVTSITVTGAGSATTITTNGGTLQMSAAVLPANATNSAVTWSEVNGTGHATISAGGLLTAVANGTVTATATAEDGSGVSGLLQITISGNLTTAQAIVAAQTVAGSVDLVLNNSPSWTTVGSSVSYSTTGLSMSGTSTTVGNTNTLNLTIALNNYADAATGYTLSGSLSVIDAYDNSTLTSSGTLATTTNLTSTGGPVTTQAWNMSYSGTGSSWTFSGTVTCNGASFDAGTLSLYGENDATEAEAAVSQGVWAIMNNVSSWTTISSDVSYSYSGISMTGTLTTGSTDIYALAITFANAHSPGVYTISGQLNLSISADHVMGTIISGTATGALTLSGGTFATETWNISTITGTMAPQPQYKASYSGTVTCDGTSFDAKTLYTQY